MSVQKLLVIIAKLIINHLTEFRAHESSLRYANELINMQNCYSITEVGIHVSQIWSK